MSNWLKKFEETAFGMLFQDQYLSPSEVVKIAEKTQASDKKQRCGTSANEAETERVQVDVDVATTPSIFVHGARSNAAR